MAENPDHAKVLQQLGWLYHQQNTSFCNQGLAIQYLTRSLKSDSNDAQSWYLLGRCYMAEQNYNKAYEAYQQAVYRDARNPTFWCSIGVLYYQINQYRDALDAYSRAIRLNPYISEVWYDLGTLYESCNNQVQDALDAYQRAAELDPSNPHIKQRLELLRKSQNVSSSSTQQQQTAAPVPQDVSNPSQYQSGQHNGQPLNGASYSQSAPTGPPSSMSAYHTAVGSSNSSRPDERVSTPQLPVVNHGHGDNNGPARDLPMPGPPPPNVSGGRRSPGPYNPYPQHNSNNNREDVRIPDIGGGRAPTPSDRSQMNPILHEERHHHSQQHHQQVQQQQQQQQPQNLPPMAMRYKNEGSPNPPPHASPHSRPSPRTAHPLAPPPPPSTQQPFDHRLSPRSVHTEGYRYEQQQQQQRSPAQRPMEVVNESAPKRVVDYNNNRPIKHEEQQRQPAPSITKETNSVEEKKERPVVDEDYDESAADVLLSMGNPQLGQKRALQQEQEENKKPRQEEPEQDQKEPTPSPPEPTIVEEKKPVKEEPEEGEVDEQEEGEVKDDEDEVMEEPVKEIPSTAAVAATDAASVAASQAKEPTTEEKPST